MHQMLPSIFGLNVRSSFAQLWGRKWFCWSRFFWPITMWCICFFIVLAHLHSFAGVHYYGYYLLRVFKSFAYFFPHCFSYISLQFVQFDRFSFLMLPQRAHLTKHQSETRTWTTDLYVPEPMLLQPDIMIINKVWHMSPWHRSLDAHWLDQPWHLTLNKRLHQILAHTPTDTHVSPYRLTEGEGLHTPAQMWTQGNVWW